MATSKDKSDNFLKEIAKKEDVKFFRGSLNKVANRYYQSAKKFKLDHFVRVTGDAILCDEIMLEKAIKSHISKKAELLRGLKQIIFFLFLRDIFLPAFTYSELIESER